MTSRADATLSTFDHAYAADGRYAISVVSSNPGGPSATISSATAIIATDYAGMQLISSGFNGLAEATPKAFRRMAGSSFFTHSPRILCRAMAILPIFTCAIRRR